MNQSFDVVIPVAAKDAGFVGRVVHRALTLLEADTVYLITKGSYASKIRSLLKGDADRCVILDENTMVPGLSFDSVRESLAGIRPGLSTGWYFQQFLKLGFATTPYARDYYLTWDADTLPLRKITFFREEHPLFTRKDEYNAPYFSTIENLLGLKKQNDFSFIAEHMMFSTNLVRELLQTIESAALEGGSWFEKIIKACDFSSPYAFSEFETYGTYVTQKYPDLYETRRLSSFRCGGFIQGRNISESKLETISFDTDIMSFEFGHEPPFPYNVFSRLQLLFFVTVFFRKYSFKQIIQRVFCAR